MAISRADVPPQNGFERATRWRYRVHDARENATDKKHNVRACRGGYTECSRKWQGHGFDPGNRLELSNGKKVGAHEGARHAPQGNRVYILEMYGCLVHARPKVTLPSVLTPRRMKDERVHITYSSRRLMSPGLTEKIIGRKIAPRQQFLTSCWTSAHRGPSGLPSSISTISKVWTSSCSMAPAVHTYSCNPCVLEAAAHEKCNTKNE